MNKKISFVILMLAVLASASLIITCKKSTDDSTTAATCSDGIQNQSETGIDCGGPCAACATASCTVPASCKNGMQDAGETDKDCGGGGCNTCPTVTAGQVKAIVDGCSWAATSIDLQYNGSTLVFKASSTSPAISIQMNYTGAVSAGSYPITSGTVIISGTTYTAASTGFLSIASVDNVNKTMEGFFSYYGLNGSTKKYVSAGKFKSISYHP